MFRIGMIEELQELNNSAKSLNDSFDVLKNFLSDEGSEAFLEEEKAFGISRDFIKFNKHLVESLDSIKIEILSNEHPPAHFHVSIAEYEGSFEIRNCTKLNGDLPRKYEKKYSCGIRMDEKKN